MSSRRNVPARGGAPRGRESSRGAPSRGGGQLAGQGRLHAGLPAPHVRTVGVRRPGFGTAGRAVSIHVNGCYATVPDSIIYHYDVAIVPDAGGPKLNFMLIKALQCENQDVFTPRAVYDGRKNMFASHRLALGTQNSREFNVTIDPSTERRPRIFKIRLTQVAEINAILLKHFTEGQHSVDNMILTAITALNVVVRMAPNQKYPFNSRSFFSPTAERLDLGHGLQVWRGYFQSVRPTIKRIFVNMDISSAVFYKTGPLMQICLEFLGQNNPQALVPGPNGLNDRRRQQLQSFLSGLRVQYAAQGAAPSRRSYEIKRLGTVPANQEMFTLQNGQTISVATYFQQQANGRPLRFPQVICVKIGRSAMVPIETCVVSQPQLCRKDLPADIQDRFRDFSTKKPADRLDSIRAGIQMFEYGQSEYVRQFGFNIDTNSFPVGIQSRVLPPPQLQYGPGSKETYAIPKFGAWNMQNRKFIRPCGIGRWAVVVFDSRFQLRDAQAMVKDFVTQCKAVGITVMDENPLIKPASPQAGVRENLEKAGQEVVRMTKEGPQLMLVVLPDHGNDIYRAVKHFGDAVKGVATQCVLAKKVRRANEQYWANVMLKVNVKLGGINNVHRPSDVRLLNDTANPTIIMGADVVHPAPGATASLRPSFAALVSSVNLSGTLYIAKDSVQRGRQEIIADLKAMVKNAIQNFSGYLSAVEKVPAPATMPKRLIFYRDGVGEGQYEQVKEEEIKLIREACDELRIRPKITFLIVGKRHHVRFFPRDSRDADRSGNCQAGTVVDTDIVHPTDFDFYLQSHAGIIGTSRSAHYMVLHDDNSFSPDALQAFSFALCHVYARSTRSVSIPAPVYYADIVCARAKTRFDPDSSLQPSDAGSVAEGEDAGVPSLDDFKRAFKPLHQLQSRRMYYM